MSARRSPTRPVGPRRDVRAPVHAQRVPRRHRDRRRERAGRLLRRAAQPGVQRRRARATSRSRARSARSRSASTCALGLFARRSLVAVGIGLLGKRGRANDVVIGTVFTWVLGARRAVPQHLHDVVERGNGAANVNVLFGSIFGLARGAGGRSPRSSASARASRCRHRAAAAVREPRRSGGRARGVPVRVLGIVFLVLVGVRGGGDAGGRRAAARRPHRRARGRGAAAHRPAVGRPRARGRDRGASMWIGLTSSYLDGSLPPSFSIMAVATAEYLGAIGLVGVSRRSLIP